MKYQIIKWTKKFPYRTFKEIMDENITGSMTGWDMIKFNMGAGIISYVVDDFIKTSILGAIKLRYANRYPYEQDTHTLIGNFYIITNDVLDSFLTSSYRLIKNSRYDLNEYMKSIENGNTNEFFTKSGTSATPYNIKFDNIGSVQTDDYLSEKNLSKTTQTSSNKDLLKRNHEALSYKFGNELSNLLNSYNPLFSQIRLDDYIENNLNELLNEKRKAVNMVINFYNERILPIYNILTKGD